MPDLMQCLHPGWLTGPIFDKEMRVSSRRRRNYVLRFVYIGLFTFLAGVLWADRVAHTPSPGSSSVYEVSRMSAAGLGIIMSVLWFQFCAAQVIAVVMLSTSISDEIYKRTLGTLMTTPIGSFQIVLGKLTSRLLQLVLLLLISLPLLAVVRVLGGVPWGLLLCGLCVTLTTVVFVGSLSLFFSIFTRRAYAAIIESIVAVCLLFWFLPGIVIALTHRAVSPDKIMNVLAYVNPYAMMAAMTNALFNARGPGLQFWPLHCAVMLGFSAVVLLLAMAYVRRAALRQAVGGSVRAPQGLPAQTGARPSASIRRVSGPPVWWKERRTPLFTRRKVMPVVGAVIVLGLLLLTYGLCAREHVLDDEEIHIMYTVVFFGVGLLFTMVLPATCITSERESRTWTLLLTTTVGDGEILTGKFLGAVRRCLPAWLLLFGHVVLFALFAYLEPIAWVHVAILTLGIVFFLTAAGLYFSTRFRHTTTAVIVNMGLGAGLWALLPLVLAVLQETTGRLKGLLNMCVDMNPFVQLVVAIGAAVHGRGVGAYHWAQKTMTVGDATGWMLLTLGVYVALGCVFLALAAWRLRRDPC
ncbi:MAG: ABC transporter permease [Planctomycetes bacterium]|jgi:ABC-type transport system involved in multi-copper enzyme maturation permease subunit|nr:ABC transporter permease [Planctomycetota bacterium]